MRGMGINLTKHVQNVYTENIKHQGKKSKTQITGETYHAHGLEA